MMNTGLLCVLAACYLEWVNGQVPLPNLPFEGFSGGIEVTSSDRTFYFREFLDETRRRIRLEADVMAADFFGTTVSGKVVTVVVYTNNVTHPGRTQTYSWVEGTTRVCAPQSWFYHDDYFQTTDGGMKGMQDILQYPDNRMAASVEDEEIRGIPVKTYVWVSTSKSTLTGTGDVERRLSVGNNWKFGAAFNEDGTSRSGAPADPQLVQLLETNVADNTKRAVVSWQGVSTTAPSGDLFVIPPYCTSEKPQLSDLPTQWSARIEMNFQSLKTSPTSALQGCIGSSSLALGICGSIGYAVDTITAGRLSSSLAKAEQLWETLDRNVASMDCKVSLVSLVCAANLPKCEGSSSQIKPCQSLCDRLQSPCTDLLSQVPAIRDLLPAATQCDSSNDDGCFTSLGKPGTGEVIAWSFTSTQYVDQENNRARYDSLVRSGQLRTVIHDYKNSLFYNFTNLKDGAVPECERLTVLPEDLQFDSQLAGHLKSTSELFLVPDDDAWNSRISYMGRGYDVRGLETDMWELLDYDVEQLSLPFPAKRLDIRWYATAPGVNRLTDTGGMPVRVQFVATATDPDNVITTYKSTVDLIDIQLGAPADSLFVPPVYCGLSEGLQMPKPPPSLAYQAEMVTSSHREACNNEERKCEVGAQCVPFLSRCTVVNGIDCWGFCIKDGKYVKAQREAVWESRVAEKVVTQKKGAGQTVISYQEWEQQGSDIKYINFYREQPNQPVEEYSWDLRYDGTIDRCGKNEALGTFHTVAQLLGLGWVADPEMIADGVRVRGVKTQVWRGFFDNSVNVKSLTGPFINGTLTWYFADSEDPNYKIPIQFEVLRYYEDPDGSVSSDNVLSSLFNATLIVDVPEDVPAMCTGKIITVPNATDPYGTGYDNPDYTYGTGATGQPLPTLPQNFETVVEIKFQRMRGGEFSSYSGTQFNMHNFAIGMDVMFRFLPDGTGHEIMVDGKNDKVYNITRGTTTCEVTAHKHFWDMHEDGSLKTTAEWFGMDIPAENIKFVGKNKMVRGFPTYQFQGKDVKNGITSTYIWNFLQDEGENEQPLLTNKLMAVHINRRTDTASPEIKADGDETLNLNVVGFLERSWDANDRQFQVPHYCMETKTPIPFANVPDNMAMAGQLVNLTGGIPTVLDFAIFHDEQNMRRAIEYYTADGILTEVHDYTTDQLVVVYPNRTCSDIKPLDPTKSWEATGGAGTLRSYHDLLKIFNDRGATQSEAGVVIRGIPCDAWDIKNLELPIGSIPNAVSNFTWYFAQEGIKLYRNGDWRVPVGIKAVTWPKDDVSKAYHWYFSYTWISDIDVDDADIQERFDYGEKCPLLPNIFMREDEPFPAIPNQFYATMELHYFPPGTDEEQVFQWHLANDKLRQRARVLYHGEQDQMMFNITDYSGDGVHYTYDPKNVEGCKAIPLTSITEKHGVDLFTKFWELIGKLDNVTPKLRYRNIVIRGITCDEWELSYADNLFHWAFAKQEYRKTYPYRIPIRLEHWKDSKQIGRVFFVDTLEIADDEGVQFADIPMQCIVKTPIPPNSPPLPASADTYQSTFSVYDKASQLRVTLDEYVKPGYVRMDYSVHGKQKTTWIVDVAQDKTYNFTTYEAESVNTTSAPSCLVSTAKELLEYSSVITNPTSVDINDKYKFWLANSKAFGGNVFWSDLAWRQKFRYANPSFLNAPTVRGIECDVWYRKFEDEPYDFLQSDATFEMWQYWSKPDKNGKTYPLRFTVTGITKAGIEIDDQFEIIDWYSAADPPASVFMPPCFCVPDRVDRCVVDDSQVHHGIYQVIQEGVNPGLVAGICIILFLVGVMIGGVIVALICVGRVKRMGKSDRQRLDFDGTEKDI